MKLGKIFAFFGLMLLLFTGMSFGQNSAFAAPDAVPNTPKKISQRLSPVMVEFEGVDSIGSRLATRLKELFNGSNLFHLEGNDVPKFRILISSAPEFETRPNIGSAYSIVWLFSLSDATLRHYLSMQVGVVSGDDVNDLAAKIVEKTDTIAMKYSYLFPEKK